MEFSKETRKKFEQVLQRYPRKEAALLPTLYLAQEEFGYLSAEVVQYVAELMEIPAPRVYGVATFYTMFNKEPVGRYHIQVCSNVSCALRGVEQLVEYLKEKLKINVGETTPDKKFTLSTVECLGFCDNSPAMQINDDYYSDLTRDKIDEILEKLK
ncbi:MAG: NADH-quinone oxidoreductase subunit NuoE [Deltaproteobacteria bacterium]|nr:MAG: NADH-quinone oxidoreductase subunit NuoE [Deltaproteobacteria bacterium]